jgi:hypothetical protein
MRRFQIESWTLRTILTTTPRTFIVIRIIVGFLHRAKVIIFFGVALAANTGRAFGTPDQHQCHDCTDKEKRQHANGKATRNAGHQWRLTAVSKEATDSHTQDDEAGICLVYVHVI